MRGARIWERRPRKRWTRSAGPTCRSPSPAADWCGSTTPLARSRRSRARSCERPPRSRRSRYRVPPSLLPALAHLDDDLAFRATAFDVGQRVFGRFEREHAIDDRSYDPGIDERTDLAQLVAARPHEEKRVAHSRLPRHPADAIAHETHGERDDRIRTDLFCKRGIGRAGDLDQRAAGS